MSTDNQANSAAARVYNDWDKALSENDVEGLLMLYAPDATLESPLVPHLLEKEEGICRGQTELRQLFEMLAKRKPTLRKHHRSTPCLQHGNIIMWEYPRLSPEGEQMEFAEVMLLNDEGLIQSQRVYWGWRGVKVLQDDAYHR